MDWLINSQDYLAILSVPIAVITVFNVSKSWRTLFDADLTDADRSLLMRVALFIVMPLIVLFHECGHAAATLFFGGQVLKFHYGFLWGYVVPSGNFSDWQVLMIYLAGNLVEIMLGLLALAIAFFASSPPVVALGVYVAFWAVGGTLIFYTLLSVMGAYGDWVAIYSSPEHAWVLAIGICHAAMVAGIIWLAYGEAPMLWFARKTNPKMVQTEANLLAEIKKQPMMDSYLSLAWLYFQHGVIKQARKYVNKIDKMAPQEPAHILLKGYLQVNEGKSADAIAIFFSCAQNTHASPLLRSRAYMAIGNCETRRIENSLRGQPAAPQIWKPALDFFTMAVKAKEDLGDPYFYRGMLYVKQGLDNLAEPDLITVLQSQCLDTNLFERAQAELVRLKLPQAPK